MQLYNLKKQTNEQGLQGKQNSSFSSPFCALLQQAEILPKCQAKKKKEKIAGSQKITTRANFKL